MEAPKMVPVTVTPVKKNPRATARKIDTMPTLVKPNPMTPQAMSKAQKLEKLKTLREFVKKDDYESALKIDRKSEQTCQVAAAKVESLKPNPPPVKSGLRRPTVLKKV